MSGAAPAIPDASASPLVQQARALAKAATAAATAATAGRSDANAGAAAAAAAAAAADATRAYDAALAAVDAAERSPYAARRARLETEAAEFAFRVGRDAARAVALARAALTTFEALRSLSPANTTAAGASTVSAAAAAPVDASDVFAALRVVAAALSALAAPTTKAEAALSLAPVPLSRRLAAHSAFVSQVRVLRVLETAHGPVHTALCGPLLALGTAAATLRRFPAAIGFWERNAGIKEAAALPTDAVRRSVADARAAIAAAASATATAAGSSRAGSSPVSRQRNSGGVGGGASVAAVFARLDALHALECEESTARDAAVAAFHRTACGLAALSLAGPVELPSSPNAVGAGVGDAAPLSPNSADGGLMLSLRLAPRMSLSLPMPNDASLCASPTAIGDAGSVFGSGSGGASPKLAALDPRVAAEFHASVSTGQTAALAGLPAEESARRFDRAFALWSAPLERRAALEAAFPAACRAALGGLCDAHYALFLRSARTGGTTTATPPPPPPPPPPPTVETTTTTTTTTTMETTTTDDSGPSSPTAVVGGAAGAARMRAAALEAVPYFLAFFALHERLTRGENNSNNLSPTVRWPQRRFSAVVGDDTAAATALRGGAGASGSGTRASSSAAGTATAAAAAASAASAAEAATAHATALQRFSSLATAVGRPDAALRFARAARDARARLGCAAESDERRVAKAETAAAARADAVRSEAAAVAEAALVRVALARSELTAGVSVGYIYGGIRSAITAGVDAVSEGRLVIAEEAFLSAMADIRVHFSGSDSAAAANNSPFGSRAGSLLCGASADDATLPPFEAVDARTGSPRARDAALPTCKSEHRALCAHLGSLYFALAAQEPTTGPDFTRYSQLSLHFETQLSATVVSDGTAANTAASLAPLFFKIGCAFTNLECFESARLFLLRCRDLKAALGQATESVERNIAVVERRVVASMDVESLMAVPGVPAPRKAIVRLSPAFLARLAACEAQEQEARAALDEAAEETIRQLSRLAERTRVALSESLARRALYGASFSAHDGCVRMLALQEAAHRNGWHVLTEALCRHERIAGPTRVALGGEVLFAVRSEEEHQTSAAHATALLDALQGTESALRGEAMSAASASHERLWAAHVHTQHYLFVERAATASFVFTSEAASEYLLRCEDLERLHRAEREGNAWASGERILRAARLSWLQCVEVSARRILSAEWAAVPGLFSHELQEREEMARQRQFLEAETRAFRAAITDPTTAAHEAGRLCKAHASFAVERFAQDWCVAARGALEVAEAALRVEHERMRDALDVGLAAHQSSLLRNALNDLLADATLRLRCDHIAGAWSMVGTLRTERRGMLEGAAQDVREAIARGEEHERRVWAADANIVCTLCLESDERRCSVAAAFSLPSVWTLETEAREGVARAAIRGEEAAERFVQLGNPTRLVTESDALLAERQAAASEFHSLLATELLAATEATGHAWRNAVASEEAAAYVDFRDVERAWRRDTAVEQTAIAFSSLFAQWQRISEAEQVELFESVRSEFATLESGVRGVCAARWRGERNCTLAALRLDAVALLERDARWSLTRIAFSAPTPVSLALQSSESMRRVALLAVEAKAFAVDLYNSFAAEAAAAAFRALTQLRVVRLATCCGRAPTLSAAASSVPSLAASPTERVPAFATAAFASSTSTTPTPARRRATNAPTVGEREAVASLPPVVGAMLRALVDAAKPAMVRTQTTDEVFVLPPRELLAAVLLPSPLPLATSVNERHPSTKAATTIAAPGPAVLSSALRSLRSFVEWFGAEDDSDRLPLFQLEDSAEAAGATIIAEEAAARALCAVEGAFSVGAAALREARKAGLMVLAVEAAAALEPLRVASALLSEEAALEARLGALSGRLAARAAASSTRPRNTTTTTTTTTNNSNSSNIAGLKTFGVGSSKERRTTDLASIPPSFRQQFECLQQEANAAEAARQAAFDGWWGKEMRRITTDARKPPLTRPPSRGVDGAPSQQQQQRTAANATTPPPRLMPPIFQQSGSSGNAAAAAATAPRPASRVLPPLCAPRSGAAPSQQRPLSRARVLFPPMVDAIDAPDDDVGDELCSKCAPAPFAPPQRPLRGLLAASPVWTAGAVVRSSFAVSILQGHPSRLNSAQRRGLTSASLPALPRARASE